MTQKKTILIIDDHPLFREGLKVIIDRSSGYEVVGEAGNGQKGIKMAEKLRPNLIILDLSLPDKSGILITREMKKILPKTKILIVSMHSKIDYITEAFQAGASGYVVKESASERLIHGLDHISADNYYIDSSISRQVIEQIIKTPLKQARITDPDYGALTAREQEVMRLVAEGLSSKEIADKLCISPKTVENHRARIMTKLDLRNTVELIRYAARIGLIDVDLWKE